MHSDLLTFFIALISSLTIKMQIVPTFATGVFAQLNTLMFILTSRIHHRLQKLAASWAGKNQIINSFMGPLLCQMVRMQILSHSNHLNFDFKNQNSQ